MRGKRCKVCGKRLRLKALYRYEITKYPAGLAFITEQPITYECFDCQNCGCQNIVGIREVKNEPVSTSD